jgi:hypothetical protein
MKQGEKVEQKIYIIMRSFIILENLHNKHMNLCLKQDVVRLTCDAVFSSNVKGL